MIKVYRTDDLIDEITGENLNLIQNIFYYVQEHEGVEATPIITRESNKIICRVPASELSKLSTGQLMFSAVVASEDPDFPDEDYQYTINEGLSVWLR